MKISLIILNTKLSIGKSSHK